MADADDDLAFAAKRRRLSSSEEYLPKTSAVCVTDSNNQSNILSQEQIEERLTKVNKILLEATDLLCKRLEPSDILRQLKTRGVLKQDDVDKIRKQDITTEKVEKLLEILTRKPVSAYQTFMEILKGERIDLFSQVKAIEARHQYHGAGSEGTACKIRTSKQEGRPSADIECIKEMVERCNRHLKELYLQRRSTIRFGTHRESVAETDNLFVNLRLLSGEGTVKIKTNQKQPDSHTDLLCIKDDKDQPCKLMLLRGHGGCGKSTLMNKLARDWSHQLHDNSNEATSTSEWMSEEATVTILDKFCLVIVLDVRRFEKGNHLEKTIQKQILPDVSLADISKVIRFTGSRCLFLVDGYDELSTECLEDRTQVLDSPLLVGCWVIVTIRPHKVDLFCQRFNGYVHLKVSGFSKASVEEYVKKFFKVHPRVTASSDLAKSLLLQIQTIPVLNSLSKYPILLLMICHLWIDRQNELNLPENLTELYKEAIWYLNKHWQERYKKGTNQVVIELGRIAIHSLFEGNLYFTADTSNDCLEDAFEIGLIDKEEMGRHKILYSFLHKTFHEFCTGAYLASLAETNDGSNSKREFFSYLHKLNTIEKIKNMEYVLLFCCGSSGKAASLILPSICKVTFATSQEERLKLPLKLFCEAETNLKTNSKDNFVQDLKETMSNTSEILALRRMKVPGNAFSPYPFNMNILLRFLQCMSHMDTLTLKNVDIVGEIDSDVSLLCKSLRICDAGKCDLGTLCKLLSCMPMLDTVLLKRVRERDTCDMCVSTNHTSLRVLKVYDKPGMAFVMKLVSFMPALEQLKIKNIDDEKTEWTTKSLRNCTRLQQLRVTSQYFELDGKHLTELLEYAPTLKRAKLCNIMMSRSSEYILQPQNCYGLTELTIHNDGSSMFISDAEMFLGVLSCLSLLQKLTLSYIQISGDLETNMSFKFKHLREFYLNISDFNCLGRSPRFVSMPFLGPRIRTDAFKGNNLVMFCRLFVCMPFLKQFKFKYGLYSRVSRLSNRIMFSAFIHRVYRKIEFTACTINAATLLMTVSRMRSLKTLSLVNVTVTGSCESVKCEINSSVVNFNLTRTQISLNTLHIMLKCIPSVAQLECICCTIKPEESSTSICTSVISRNCLTKLQIEGNTNNSVLQHLGHLVSSIEELTLDFDVLRNSLAIPHNNTNSMALKHLYLFYEKITEIMMIKLSSFLGNISSIETLTLAHSNSDDQQNGEHGKVAEISLKTLFQLLHCNPVINNLTLRDISINGVISDKETPYEPLKELNIVNSEVDENAISLKFLQLLPSLATLSLEDVDITAERIEENPTRNDSLKKFIIGFSKVRHTPLELGFLHYMPSLECLTIENVKLSESFDTELPRICNSLKEFHLWYTFSNKYMHVFSIKGLSAMSSLKVLSFINIKGHDSVEEPVDTIISSLHEFHLVYRHCATREEAFFTPPLTAYNDSTLVRVLRRASSLQRLHICSVDIKDALDVNKLLAAKLITHMTLADVKISAGKLASLLSNIRSVETLIFQNVDIAGKLPKSIQGSCKSLKEFQITICRTSSISAHKTLAHNIKTLLNFMTSLQTLYLSIETSDVIDAICADTTETGVMLKTLTISCNRYWDIRMSNIGAESQLFGTVLNFISRLPLLKNWTLEFGSQQAGDIEYSYNIVWKEMPTNKSLDDFSLVYKKDQDGHGHEEDYFNINYNMLTELSNCMPNLQKLALRSCYIRPARKSGENMATLKPISHISDCIFQTCKASGAALLKLLSRMPSLQKLDLVDVDLSLDQKEYFESKVAAMCEELVKNSNIDEDKQRRIRDVTSTMMDDDEDKRDEDGEITTTDDESGDEDDNDDGDDNNDEDWDDEDDNYDENEDDNFSFGRYAAKGDDDDQYQLDVGLDDNDSDTDNHHDHDNDDHSTE